MPAEGEGAEFWAQNSAQNISDGLGEQRRSQRSGWKEVGGFHPAAGVGGVWEDFTVYRSLTVGTLRFGLTCWNPKPPN